MPDQEGQPFVIELTCEVRRIGIAQVGRHSVEVEVSADRMLVRAEFLDEPVDLQELLQFVRAIEEIDRELRKDGVPLGSVSKFRREAERRSKD